MAQVINKYVWLADTIRKAGSGGITFQEINEKWLRKDNVELSGGVEIPQRTFHKWRAAVEEMFNVIIDCRRKGGYHYFIANPEDLKDHGMSNWLLDTVSVSNLLMQNIALKDRILLENVPSGLQFLADILEAMNSNQTLNITYQGFWHNTPVNYDVHPYCVKLFKQRWYMVANKVAEGIIHIFAVDRILDIKSKKETFEVPADFDPAGYFHNSYGVMIGTQVPQRIRIKVDGFQANYLRSLPLHHSQREESQDGRSSIFTYLLCPEHDFLMELLSLGDTIEVLEPVALRDEIAAIAQNMNKTYNIANKRPRHKD